MQPRHATRLYRKIYHEKEYRITTNFVDKKKLGESFNCHSVKLFRATVSKIKMGDGTQRNTLLEMNEWEYYGIDYQIDTYIINRMSHKI